MRRILPRIALALLGLAVAIQLVPYGREHPNPPVTTDAPWPSAEARALAVGACYDCHSNETEWPWYTWVAPVSWLVASDVEEGREELNFSRWDREQDADDLVEVVEEGSMPPRNYRLLHPEARLSESEKAELVAALAGLQGKAAGDDRRGPDRGSG